MLLPEATWDDVPPYRPYYEAKVRLPGRRAVAEADLGAGVALRFKPAEQEFWCRTDCDAASSIDVFMAHRKVS